MSQTTQPVHGNYHGYYMKRPFFQDPRLSVIPDSYFIGARVLDVGCNEGWVTCEIAQSKRVGKAVGVDIDDTLVRAAWKRRRYVWSMQEPQQTMDGERDAPAGPKKRKRTSEGTDPSATMEPQLSRPDYFPASCEHMFGPLPIPPASHGKQQETFPHNVTFRTADWVNQEILEDSEGYNIVLALSVSKWIHLNGGDEGLTRFFRRVHSVLRLGGRFILEPQEWESYAKARRMDPRLKENAHGLKLRPEHFESTLQDIGFGGVEHLGRTGEGGFRRPVDVYMKTN